MTVIGGNTEKKEIGLPIDISGKHDKTEINKSTGFLQLVEIDVDGEGNPIYVEKGSWTSDVIDLGDIFQDFEKVFTTSNVSDSSSFAVLTRVSSDSDDWSDWTPIALDGTIQSETEQYIQVRIDLFAGFVSDAFFISKSDFNLNKYIEEKEYKTGGYIVPTLTSNTSSADGFAFSETEHSVAYSPWKAFEKVDTTEGYVTKSGVTTGYLGFFFNSGARVSKYKLRNAAGSVSYLPRMIKDWVLQASNDTTDGHDGTWIDLDIQTNQVWTTGYTDKTYEIPNKEKYQAYRVKWSANNGHNSYSGIGELDFYENGTTSLGLKRKYEDDMILDSTWIETGSLHRHKITRSEWMKIDRLNVSKKS